MTCAFVKLLNVFAPGGPRVDAVLVRLEDQSLEDIDQYTNRPLRCDLMRVNGRGVSTDVEVAAKMGKAMLSPRGKCDLDRLNTILPPKVMSSVLSNTPPLDKDCKG